MINNNNKRSRANNDIYPSHNLIKPILLLDLKYKFLF